MSYKYTVLQDNPLAFFLLDEVRSGTAGVYDNLRTTYATYADLRDNGISYAAVSGLPIKDYSGNGMEGYAIDSSNMEVLPIIGAGVRGTEVNDSASIRLKASGIATNKKPDSPFSIETWFSPSSDDMEEYLIVGDDINKIGLYYNNENIIFRCNENTYVSAKVSKNQAMYIVGVFSKSTMYLYVNGVLASEKNIGGSIKFTNDLFAINIGPANVDKRFIIDSVGIYDYELDSTICLKHYKSGYKETKYSQIVYSDDGIFFSLNASSIKPAFSYRYPGNKTLSEIVSGDAYYNSVYDRIEFEKTADLDIKSFIFEDTIYVTSPEKIVSSRISYGQDVSNIVVEVKVPNQPWAICENNAPIPYYNKNQNLNSPILDIRVTMSTDDSSFDLPYFNKLEIDMYSNKDFYSDNSGSRIYSDYDYSIGYSNYPVRMQNKYNGLSMLDGHGFSVETSMEPRTIELFFTPRGTSNILFSSSSSSFSWAEDGAISKNGISSIYINGINRTSSTNISEFFLPDVSHHVLIVLDSDATNIKFNQSQSGLEYGASSTYNNIALYKTAFSQAKAETHYRLYCSDNSMVVTDPGLTVSESASGVDGTANFVRLFD